LFRADTSPHGGRELFEDFGRAWEPEEGHFGPPVRVYHAWSTHDERKILSFGFLDVSTEGLPCSRISLLRTYISAPELYNLLFLAIPGGLLLP